MNTTALQTTAAALVASGKGLLAADETVWTLGKRLEARGIPPTVVSRRDYRELLFDTPGIDAFISGVILQDETIHQASADEVAFVELLATRAIIPGIKVDSGIVDLPNAPGESVTEGLDGLRDRLAQYRQLGARFAKWRAVLTIGDARPSRRAVLANAHALARYAALCQEQDIVPIVEPEVLMDGTHAIERCEEVTSDVLQAVFAALDEQLVWLEGMLLKPNMVIAGAQCRTPATVSQVAESTLRCLRRHVPAAVPGIVFLSGGQDPVTATRLLDAINRLDEAKPWPLTFSYGRALQDEALAAWQGRKPNVEAGQHAFLHRAQCVGAAALGRYSAAMEEIIATTR